MYYDLVNTYFGKQRLVNFKSEDDKQKLTVVKN